MTSSSSVTEQNRLLLQLLSLHSASSRPPKKRSHFFDEQDNALLIRVSDQVPAGRGLVFTRHVEPGQLLLSLPAEALINVKSYKAFLHPDTLPSAVSVAGRDPKGSQHRLSSAQLLSLLLARARVESELEPSHGKRTPDASFKHEALRLFVQTLPTSFETVPVTWSIYARGMSGSAEADARPSTPKERFYSSLLQALPRHSQDLERKVRKRFETDWRDVCSVRETRCDLLAEPALLSSDPHLARRIVRSISLETFLWAWLCVNSRCVFLPLGLADHADNFTLAPMLDMANHTPDAALECKVRYADDGGLELCAPIAPPAIKQGDECFITYGPHSNESLLSEYGFVLPAQLDFVHNNEAESKRRWRGSRYVDVSMDREVESFLSAQGPDGEAKIELLQNRGYWGEFTIHPYPEPAHPSHRLVPALRLAALDIASSASEPCHAPKLAKVKAQPGVKAGKKMSYRSQGRLDGNGMSNLDNWEETLTGYRDKVSDANEQQAHAILLELCDVRRKDTMRARRHLQQAQASLDASPNDGEGRTSTAVATQSEPSRASSFLSLAFVQQLLDEEEEVLRLVSQAAKEQVEW